MQMKNVDWNEVDEDDSATTPVITPCFNVDRKFIEIFKIFLIEFYFQH